jgi:hypothetical protein
MDSLSRISSSGADWQKRNSWVSTTPPSSEQVSGSVYDLSLIFSFPYFQLSILTFSGFNSLFMIFFEDFVI